MTHRIGFLFGMRPASRFAIVLAALHGLSACATATIDDAVPTAQATPAAVGEPTVTTADAPADISAAGGETQGNGKDTGTFPNLNIAPTVAAEQITPAEKQAKLAQLSAEKQQQAVKGAAARPTANAAELKKLAATHAEEALKQIEGD